MKLTTKNKKVPEYLFGDWVLDSYLEVYMCYYLQCLKDLGYIVGFKPHTKKWDLTPKFTRPYKRQLKTKVKDEEYHLLNSGSYTADISILWHISAENLWYLNPSKPVKNIKDIPFRLSSTDGSLVSHIEVKSTDTSTTSSIYSFVIWQKVIMKDYNEYVQRICPFTPYIKDYKKTLFYNTFYPEEVIKEQVYKVKYGKYKPGDSKIKHRYLTCEQYLKKLEDEI